MKQFSLFLFFVCFISAYGQNTMIIGIDNNQGSHNKGRLFSIDSNLRVQTLKDFNYVEGLDHYETSDLILGNNGKYYGLTQRGDGGQSFIFEYDIHTNDYQIIYRFDYTQWGYVFGLSKHPNGLFYGVSSGSTIYNYGCLYSFNPSTRTVNLVHAFNAVNQYPNAPIIIAKNNKIYGSVRGGANPSKGSLYEFDLSSGTLTSLHQFTGFYSRNNSNLVDGNDSCIYGIRDGSYPYYGRIYKYNYSTRQFSLVHEIDVRTHPGRSYPYLSISNRNLYASGNNGNGPFASASLYHINLNASSYRINNAYQFVDSTQGNQFRGLLKHSSKGEVIGTLFKGGTNNEGSIFKLDSSLNLIQLSTPFSKSRRLFRPIGRLILKNDSSIIGVASNEPDRSNLTSYISRFAHGIGGIYEYNFSSDSLYDRILFGKSDLGHVPVNNLLRDGNSIYICNSRGGKYFSGTLLKYDIYSQHITKLADVDSSIFNQINSISLLDPNTIVGLGTKDSLNKLFEFNLTSNSFSIVDSLPFAPNRLNQLNSLFLAANQKFYFVNSEVFNLSPLSINEYDPITQSVSQVFDLATLQIDGVSPEFVELNQKLYVTYKQSSNRGILEFDYLNGNIRLFSFSGGTMRVSEKSSPTLHSNGKIYGLAIENYARTFIYEFDPNQVGNKFQIKSLVANYEAESIGKFAEDSNGSFYFKLIETSYNLFNAKTPIQFVKYDVPTDSSTIFNSSLTKFNGSSLNGFLFLPNYITMLYKRAENKGFSVFPNPAQNHLNISYSDKIIELSIYTQEGKLIESLKKGQKTIDLANYANGFYFIRQNEGKNTKALKFIVNR